MSIILKALKKAEEGKAEKSDAKTAQTYMMKDSRTIGTIIAGIAVAGLLIFFGFLFYQKNIASKQKTTASAKITEKTPQSPDRSVTTRTENESPIAPAQQIPAVPEIPDAKKLSDEAVKQITEKNYAGAETTLRKALLVKPDDSELYNNLGIALKNQGKYKDAAAAYEKALEIKKDYIEAMNNLAVTYEALGLKNKAKALYRKALSLKPSYAEAHLNYALLLESENNEQEAISHYHTFLNLSSDETLKKKVSERLKTLKK